MDNSIDIEKLTEIYKQVLDDQRKEQKTFSSQAFNDMTQEEKRSYRIKHIETNAKLTTTAKLLREYIKENPQYVHAGKIEEMLKEAFPEPQYEPAYNYVYAVFFPSETDTTTKICVKGKMWQVYGKNINPYWNIQPFINGKGYDENVYEHIGKFKVLKFFDTEEDMAMFHTEDVG